MYLYRIDRYHSGRLMAEGAKVTAENDFEAIKKARALFSDREFADDRFEISSVYEVPPSEST